MSEKTMPSLLESTAPIALPLPRTKELQAYFSTYAETADFNLATFQGLVFIQHFLALEKTAPGLRDKGNLLEFMSSPAAVAYTEDRLKLYMFRIHLEGYLIRSTFAFDSYLSGVLRHIFTERPEILKSNKATVTYQQMLDFPDRENFIRWAASLKASELADGGMHKILEYLVEEKKCKLVGASEEMLRDASEYLAIRNLISQNAGLVNSTFLVQTKRTDVKEGEMLPLERKAVLIGGRRLLQFAGCLDSSVVKHFRLKTGLVHEEIAARSHVGNPE